MFFLSVCSTFILVSLQTSSFRACLSICQDFKPSLSMTSSVNVSSTKLYFLHRPLCTSIQIKARRYLFLQTQGVILYTVVRPDDQMHQEHMTFHRLNFLFFVVLSFDRNWISLWFFLWQPRCLMLSVLSIPEAKNLPGKMCLEEDGVERRLRRQQKSFWRRQPNLIIIWVNGLYR